MKPHIWKSWGLWFCTPARWTPVGGDCGVGMSPQEAFKSLHELQEQRVEDLRAALDAAGVPRFAK